jgi:hypothetical protein
MSLPPNTGIYFNPNDGFTAHIPTEIGTTVKAITDSHAFTYMRECGSLHTADAVTDRNAFDMYFAGLVSSDAKAFALHVNADTKAQYLNREALVIYARIAQQMVELRNRLYPL